MYKRARELRKGDVFVNSIGCMFNVESTELFADKRGRLLVEIKHPRGVSHTILADKVVECF